jgi:hypothetical protein
LAEKKKVIVAVGDEGARQYFDVIYSELQGQYDVLLLADPKGAAIKALKDRGIAHKASDGLTYEEDGKQVEVDLTGVAAVLCGTAGKAFDLWRNITEKALAAGVQVAWFGDFYASGCEPQVADLAPNYMAFFDDSTMARFLVERPNFDPSRARAIGNPAFDEIARFDPERARQYMRMGFGMNYYSPGFMFYSASSMSQFNLKGESLDNLVPYAKEQKWKFGMRLHPADAKNSPEKVAECMNYVNGELGGQVVNVGDLRGLPLYAAADVLVTDYSTEGVKACLAGIPTVFLMLESSQDYMRKNKGGDVPFFSILEGSDGESPALGVFDIKDLNLQMSRIIEWSNSDVLDRLKQPRYQILRDGKAGERALAFIKEIVG